MNSGRNLGLPLPGEILSRSKVSSGSLHHRQNEPTMMVWYTNELVINLES